jgi:capsular exopolysaccharide synthesis family protein
MTIATPPRVPKPIPPREPRGRSGGPSGRGKPQVDPFRVLRRYALAIIGSGFLGATLGVAAYVLLLRFYPLYAGKVLFEILPGVRDVREIGVNDIFQDQLVFRLGMTESMLLTSEEVVEAALRDPAVRRTSWFQRNYEHLDNSVDAAVDDLLDELKTNVMRNTNLFSLSWSTHEAEDVAVVLNAIQRAYRTKRRALDTELYDENIGVFERQLDKTIRDIANLDTEIEQFIRNNGLESLTDPRDSQVAYYMRELSEKITDSEGALKQAITTLQQTQEKLEGTIEWTEEDRLRAERDSAVGSSVQMVQSLKIELNEAEKKYGPEHKHVQNLAMRLRSAEDERDTKIEEVITLNLQAALQFYQDQVEQLQQVLDGYEAEQEVQRARLRDLAANQAEYKMMVVEREYLAQARDADMQLLKEVELMKLRVDASRVRLAREALIPRELSFPRLEIVIPLGTLLVMGLTVGLIFLREFTDQRVKSASDLAMLPGVRIVGIVPDVAEDPTKVDAAEIVVKRHPHSVLAESYRQAFATLTKPMDLAGHQTLLVLGGLPGSGTTTAVSNLSHTWAAAGRRVAVVDANFRRPRLAESMGVDGQGPGLGDVLAGIVTLNEALVDASSNISVLPVGSPPNRVFELLNTREFDSLIAELRDRFDLVIFDAPPAIVAGESMVLANKLDASLLVVRANQEHRGLVGRIVGQLGDAHCDMLGILLNRPRGTAGGYFKKNFATMAAYSAGKS